MLLWMAIWNVGPEREFSPTGAAGVVPCGRAGTPENEMQVRGIKCLAFDLHRDSRSPGCKRCRLLAEMEGDAGSCCWHCSTDNLGEASHGSDDSSEIKLQS